MAQVWHQMEIIHPVDENQMQLERYNNTGERFCNNSETPLRPKTARLEPHTHTKRRPEACWQFFYGHWQAE